MGKFTRAEIEQAVGHYTTVAEGCSSSGDWRPFADLFTEDVVYIEHHYGVFHGREAGLDCCGDGSVPAYALSVRLDRL
jgi:hypothetical protein